MDLVKQNTEANRSITINEMWFVTHENNTFTKSLKL